MTLTTEELFQYFLIFLVVLWPLWVLAFVFLRALVLKIGSLFRGKKIEPIGVFVIRPPTDVEKATAR